jgi:hypothetical protein
MAGGARLVITNPILSISVVSLLTIYATLPTYAQTRIRGAIVFLLRVIFIQTPTVGLNTVMMIFNSIVVPLWQIINWLVAAPGQAVMALFNLFSSTSNRSWDAMTRWVAGMWSYITNSPMVSLARTMITGSSMPTSSMSTSSMPTFSRSSSDAAAQRAELATLLTSQLEAIPKSPSSNSSNAASSSSTQATTSGFQAASNSNQEFTVTASTGLNATPMPNLTFTATAPENTTAEAAITQTISSLNENSTQQEVNSSTSSLTASLTPPDQASVPSPEQLRDTTTTLVEAVVNAGDRNTVREIRNTSRNNTPANSQVPGEEPVSPQNASIAAAALEVLDKSITMGTKRKDEDEETAGTPRDIKPRTDDDDDDEGVTGGRRKSRRRRSRSTKKRPIRRRRITKRRGTKRRGTKRRQTKRRR